MSCVNFGEAGNLKDITKLLYSDDTCMSNCFEDCTLSCGLPWSLEFDSDSDLSVATSLLEYSDDVWIDLGW